MMFIKIFIPAAFAFCFVWFAVEQKQLNRNDYSQHYSCMMEKYSELDTKFKADSINYVKKIQQNNIEIKKDLAYLQKVDVLMDSIVVVPKDKRKGWLKRQLKEVKNLNHK